MEAVVLIGLQGSGKSTFCRERFYDTHLRINLDLLKTRYRERRLLEVCVETQLRFVVDNTNVTRAERQVYLEAARRGRMRTSGYLFESNVEDCIHRNESRPSERQVPTKGILGARSRFEPPSFEEGFDELYTVRIGEDGGFVVEEWPRPDGAVTQPSGDPTD